MTKFPDVDWWCDECNAHMNIQSGFDDSHGTWNCTDCGYENSITSEDIIVIDDFEEDEEDYSEALDVSDAADIWASNGFDEDYTFGYSEDELRKEL